MLWRLRRVVTLHRDSTGNHDVFLIIKTMSSKTIIKLGVAVILITAGTVLKNSAIKEMGNSLIK